MRPERAGMLPRTDPLYRFLTEVVLSGSSPRGDFEVFRLNGPEGAVYLYVNAESGVRLVGKFYGRKWTPGQAEETEDLRSLLVRREFENLLLLRRLGFDSGPHLVPQPLATSDAIDWLLVEEYVEGFSLHHAIWQMVQSGGKLLERSLSMAAELLARLHRFPTPPRLLPPKDVPRYFAKLLSQLCAAEMISAAEADRFAALGARWEASGILSHDCMKMVHGDATPEHFFYDEPERRMHVIDVESLRHGDPAEDVGYLAGEIKHLFWRYTRDPWSSEPLIQHLYRSYAREADLSQSEMKQLTQRGRYYMGCAELRIARNAWLPLEHRLSLIAEAERCLTM